MSKIKFRGFSLIELLVVIAIVGIIAFVVLGTLTGHVANGRVSFSAIKAEACGFFTDCPSETSTAAAVQKNLITAVPIPQITNSLERVNVAKRAQLFDSPDKTSYIYLISYGKVMAFYTVKGKVSSLQSYMVPTDKLVYGDGTPCHYSSDNCYTIAAPDIDGTYGDNDPGIFFFTTEGAYVEWHGDYMMSDQALQLSTQPELVRTVK